ncbi:MAG: RND family transporter, partial [Candidatus Binatia bacterium]
MTFSPEAELFSYDSIAQLGKLRDELSKVEGVAEVVSMLDIPLFKNQDLPLTEAVKNTQKLADDGVDPDKARVEILESPIYRDLILSADARTTAVLINLQEDAEYTRLLRERDALRTKRRVEGLSGPEQQRLESTSAAYDVLHEALNAQRHRIVEEVRAIMAPYKKLGVLYLGGVPMITDDMVTFVKNDLIVFGAGVLVFLIAVLTLIFRQLRWIILPLLSCFYAGLVMIGVLGLIGWKVTVISSNFLALMLIITISMNIHLIVRYRQLRRDYPTSRQLDLVRTTTGKMVKPCLYTALTTIMGFSSLVVSDIKPVIDFGWMMSAGLAVTFLTSFLLFPAILVVLEKPAVTQDKEREFKLPERLATLTEVHGGKVLVLSIAVAALSGVGISRLKVENSFINYFSDSTEIYQGLKLIDRELGGTTPLEVILTLTEDEADLWYTEAELAEMGDEEREEALEIERQQKEEMAKPEYWFTPLKIERIKAAHDYLDGLSEVGKVMSLASVIRVGEDLNKGKEFDSFQLSLLYNQAPDEVKRTTIEPFVNFAHSEARILMRILDSKEDLRRKDLLDKVRRGLVQKLGFAEEKVTVTGLLVLYNNMLQSLFK